MTNPLFEALMNASCDGIFVAEASTGIITFANKAACQLFGYQQEELVGKHQTFLHPDEDCLLIKEKFKEFASHSDYKEINTRIISKSNQIIPVKITSANLVEHEGVVYAIAYFKNLTLEENMRKITFMQSHVVRRPLANIIGACTLIKEGLPETTEDLVDMTNIILYEAEELDKIIKEIVDTAN